MDRHCPDYRRDGRAFYFSVAPKGKCSRFSGSSDAEDAFRTRHGRVHGNYGGQPEVRTHCPSADLGRAFLSGAAAALIVSMTVLGAILGSGTAAELGVGSLVAIGVALATWFFIFALRGELRCDPARAGWAKRRTKAKE